MWQITLKIACLIPLKHRSFNAPHHMWRIWDCNYGRPHAALQVENSSPGTEAKLKKFQFTTKWALKK